ncbi:DUF1071 domain-containing protein [Turicibacter sanguinis]|uniref:Sak single strand annealing protein n=1 Tax=Turicibacter sanguinis TaxID=154288 RepID=UPI0012BC73B4|nr:DUF1071 domain-containing protein [Turicibacter sanguinis]MDB8436755.1 DUF1071 domain-containing protein [Turicibacter sanguinis]MTO05434.1 DUF1071 domain-containing protein [Turicibacter sanguinis]MTO19578.1 DUF1071 domain-containing protein [Turicibacter sanguinis]MTO25320.1 DUF1071 domain-containing protein [Turicibacter sanguinis]MTO31070.1 DUF1071 domain-containing protein [Turicibacter sanguinis]
MEAVKTEEVVEECRALEFDVNLFNKLYNLDVSVYKEQLKTKTATLDYLSWAQAYQLLIHQDPNADVKICEAEDGFPLFSRGDHHFVKTEVTAFGKTKPCWLPVMDNNHRAVKDAPYQVPTKNGSISVPAMNARHINDSIMRCMVKNIALFGIGLKLYTGEDLRQYKEVESVQEESITKTQMNQINELSKEKKVEFIQINEYCKKNFKAPLDKITRLQGVGIIEMLKNTPDPQQ